eukprot:4438323-Amphidinium_carterae.1
MEFGRTVACRNSNWLVVGGSWCADMKVLEAARWTSVVAMEEDTPGPTKAATKEVLRILWSCTCYGMRDCFGPPKPLKRQTP